MPLATLDLIAKILVVPAIPIAILIVWQRCTQSHWNILVFALGAFAVNYLLLSRLLGTVILDFVEGIVPSGPPPYRMFLYPPWLTSYFIFGLIRESVIWLVIYYKATNVRSWQSGIMFGLAYASVASLVLVGTDFFRSLQETDLLKSTLELVVAGKSRPSFEEIVDTLNYEYFWWFRSLILMLKWGVTLTILNVGTSLAVVFSVKRRNVFLFLVAVALYVLHTNSLTVMVSSSLPDMRLDWLPRAFTTTLIIEVGIFAFSLPSLLLVFLLRRPFMRMEA